MSEMRGLRPHDAARVNPADRAQLDRKPVPPKRLLALFKPHAGTIALVMGLIVVSSLAGLAQPFLVREVIDVAIPEQRTGLLVGLVVGMLAVTIVAQLVGIAQTWLSSRTGQRVMHSLRSEVFANLQRQSLGFFTRTRSGEVQSRLINDVAGMQSIVTTSATAIATNLTTAIATAIAMVALSWRLSLLSLIVLPPAILLTRRVALIRRDVTAERQATMAQMHGVVEETLSVSGMRLTKTLGAQERVQRRFEKISSRLIDLELRSQLAGRSRIATMQIMVGAIPALVYLVAGWPGLTPGMTIGTLIAFTTLQNQIFRPLLGLLNIGAQWVASMALFSRIFEYLDLEPEIPEPSEPVAIDPTQVVGEVRFEGVSFAYPDSAVPALTDIDLTIPAGQTLAVVGETGSGKSTLASLLARLNDPSSGRILIDGMDLRQISASDRVKLIGMVSQETYLMHDSVRANLLLARPDASEAELWTALQIAQIDHLIADLPDGLETLVGARGYRFSGGEQQRIAIARTILRNPPILILDEATSALDNETEREVQAALDALAQHRTTLTIAHRLSTVRNAESIAVLDAGRVVELGEHEQLLAAGGRYALLAQQSVAD